MAYYASRESVAYNYDEMMSPFSRTPPAPKPEPAPHPQLQAIPGGKARTNTNPLFQPKTFLTLMLVLLTAGVVLYSYMLVAQLTSDVASKRIELDELRAINTALLTKQEYELSDETIEEYAQQSGMFKLDNSQVEWFEMSNPDKVEIAGSGTGITGVRGRLMQSFNATMAYLN